MHTYVSLIHAAVSLIHSSILDSSRQLSISILAQVSQTNDRTTDVTEFTDNAGIETRRVVESMMSLNSCRNSKAVLLNRDFSAIRGDKCGPSPRDLPCLKSQISLPLAPRKTTPPLLAGT